MIDTDDRSQPRLVPDTLDLAERARLGINGLLGTLDPRADYEPYFWAFFMSSPPYFVHISSQYSADLCKYLEALPLLRLASGSRQGLDVEQATIAAVLKNTSHDGMIYDEERPDRPWNCSVGYGIRSWREDYACLAGQGRLLTAYHNYHALTGDPMWLERMARTAKRVGELLVEKDDYGYYPNVGCGGDFCYPKHSGWVHTNEPGHGLEGAEGATLWYQSQAIRGLVRWHKLSGDERALEVSRRLANFVLKPRFWGGYNDLDPAAGAARGHFWGHYHGAAATLRALLEYATIVGDWPIKEFVRGAYEWARHHAIPQLGLFPGNRSLTEGCTIADMVALAIQLTDAGIGDYWDDVDHYVRNGLVEDQVIDQSELERMAEASPRRPKDAPWGAAEDPRFVYGYQREPLPGQESTDDVIGRSLGTFSVIVSPYHQIPYVMACCNGNCNQAIYYAWEAIVRHRDGSAQVNLLLNRRSAWVDVESSLPYAGEVVLRNKTARKIDVRIPAWVDRPTLCCRVDESPVEPTWIGSFVQFEGLRPGQVVALSFPVTTLTRKLVHALLNGRPERIAQTYTCQFRGSTAVGIEEPGEDPAGRRIEWYRIFRRSNYQGNIVPTRQAAGYTAPKVIDW